MQFFEEDKSHCQKAPKSTNKSQKGKKLLLNKVKFFIKKIKYKLYLSKLELVKKVEQSKKDK